MHQPTKFQHNQATHGWQSLIVVPSFRSRVDQTIPNLGSRPIIGTLGMRRLFERRSESSDDSVCVVTVTLMCRSSAACSSTYVWWESTDLNVACGRNSTQWREMSSITWTRFASCLFIDLYSCPEYHQLSHWLSCPADGHEGRLINKLQNGIILLIFKIWKIQNIGFVHNLIVSTTCEFYYNDVTVV